MGRNEVMVERWELRSASLSEATLLLGALGDRTLGMVAIVDILYLIVAYRVRWVIVRYNKRRL